MFFIQPTADSVEAALRSWTWLPIEDKKPYAVTVLGDVFLEDDKGLWFLDRIEGTLSFAADSHERLQQILDSEAGQDHYLWFTLVEAAKVEEMHLDDNECYDFKVAPILGGAVELENIEIREFELVLLVAGQVHGQMQATAASTDVDENKLVG